MKIEKTGLSQTKLLANIDTQNDNINNAWVNKSSFKHLQQFSTTFNNLQQFSISGDNR